MAAAIIPLIASAIGVIGPQIPSIVKAVEGWFGHSSQTGNKDGGAKLQTVVDILTAALTGLANAGKIPSAPVVDPSLPAGLAGAVQQVVDTLKAQGLLEPPPIQQPLAAIKQQTLAMKAGQSILISVA